MRSFSILTLLSLFFLQWTCVAQEKIDAGSVQPYTGNPYYWEYKGAPVVLLGGTWQDNLFNHPEGLERHLDLLLESGGNYVRNTMSHRNTGNLFAYEQIDGKYDLDRFNEEYWQRFEDFLSLAYDRDIIIQIEVFDPWDLFTDEGQGGWSKHPFNPANNINYTAEQSGLPTSVDYVPTGSPSEHPFYRTVPALDNNKLFLDYQRAYVDRMLSHSLRYPNVLYSIQNESGEELEFGDYWADYIHQKARDEGRKIYVTDMRRSGNTRSSDHNHIYNNPERYNYLDIAQNSWQTGQIHYDRIIYVRDLISDAPRPINTVKIYNRDGVDESIARFFRVFFAGGASARFHRPSFREDPDAHEVATEWGLGLSPRSQSTIRSARMLFDYFDLFAAVPRNELLSERSSNEAYLLAQQGKQYAVYFPDGGEVKLDVSDIPGALTVRWLDIDSNRWLEEQQVNGGGKLDLKSPGTGHWAVVVHVILSAEE